MDKYIISMYGANNLDKVKTNVNKGSEESKRRFIKKYPYANLSKFEFQAGLDKDGNIDGYTVYYKIDDVSSYDITSDTFLNNKEWVKHLYWQEPWGIKGTVQPFTSNTTTTRKVNYIKIYVTSDQFFEITLPGFDISNGSSNDYKDNTYLAALFAAYITTYSCGISTEHFEYNSKTPEIVTSIARYHLYYHMRRFIRQPGKMSRFVTLGIKTIITNNKPVVYEWSKEKFHQGQENVGYWVSKQPPGTIRNAWSKMSRYGGQVGIYYQKRGAQTIRSLDDYKLFIADKSNGLTKTGQLLLQQSVESYVYCVLGAQAKTRWPIVGRGAMSIQTQDVFRKLVADTIIQDDQTVAVTNMRKAIKDTNVVLDTAISPGVTLIPSNMIILKEMVSGYNNILTLAESGMRFGKNEGVNYHDIITRSEDIVAKTAAKTAAKPTAKTEVRPAAHNGPKLEIYLLVISLIGGSLISKFII
jgi:hypothetical protein